MEADFYHVIGAMLAAGAVSGITAGMFGVGGGFVVVPALLAVFSLLDAPGFEQPGSGYIHLAVGSSLAPVGEVCGVPWRLL